MLCSDLYGLFSQYILYMEHGTTSTFILLEITSIERRDLSKAIRHHQQHLQPEQTLLPHLIIASCVGLSSFTTRRRRRLLATAAIGAQKIAPGPSGATRGLGTGAQVVVLPRLSSPPPPSSIMPCDLGLVCSFPHPPHTHTQTDTA